MLIKITAESVDRNARRRVPPLQIQSQQERPAVPSVGSTLELKMPLGKIDGAPLRTVSFTVTKSKTVWKPGEEYGEIVVAGNREDIVYLALCHEWELTHGIETLSEEQRGLIRCATGTCGGHQHA